MSLISEPTVKTATSKAMQAKSGDGNDEHELQDLDSSLLSFEKLDRDSPELWPDYIPGVSHFIPLRTPNDSPAAQPNALVSLSQEDLSTVHQLGSLPLHVLLEEVQRLQNIAYQLGLEERKEMTRGKYLNILRRKT